MPTKRAAVLFILALVLYFLANQTQVGWLYVITAGFAGLLMAAWVYNWRMLKAVTIHRTLQPLLSPATGIGLATGRTEEASEAALVLPTFYEDDRVEIGLQLHNSSMKPVLLLNGDEFCPFAPAGEQAQPFFVPSLLSGRPVSLSYQTACDRRGLHTFPPTHLHSRGAFGLFRASRTLTGSDTVLVYPQYYALRQLRAMERREFTERRTMRAGAGNQVLGTREYRTGDSLRQVHWRSTARTGRLVVKEFAEETQTALTVILDGSATGNVGQGKFSTFETAVRIAASLAYYANHKQIPFYLVGAGPASSQTGRGWVPPAAPLGWWAVLNYLARVTNNGSRPLAAVLNDLPTTWPGPLTSSFLVVLASRPDEATGCALQALAQSIQGMAILIMPDDETPLPAAFKPAGMEVRRASPYNWATVLAK